MHVQSIHETKIATENTLNRYRFEGDNKLKYDKMPCYRSLYRVLNCFLALSYFQSLVHEKRICAIFKHNLVLAILATSSFF